MQPLDTFIDSVRDAAGHGNVRNAVVLAVVVTIGAIAVTLGVGAFLLLAPGEVTSTVFSKPKFGLVVLGVPLAAWVGAVVAIGQVRVARRQKLDHACAMLLRDDPEAYAELLAALRAAPRAGETDAGGRRVGAAAARKLRYDVLAYWHVPAWLKLPLLRLADKQRADEGPHDIAPLIRARYD